MTWREPRAGSKPQASQASDALEGTRAMSHRLEELFERHHQRLFRLAVRMTSDSEAARDLVQEVFLRLARSPHRVPSGEPAGEAWAVRTLVNLCRDRYRRRKVREDRAWKLAGRDREASSETAVVARATLERAMTVLSPRRRAILVLVELEGCSPVEVAEVLGLASATVRWHLAAARRQLARELESREGSRNDQV